MFLIAEDIADQLTSWGCEVVGPDSRPDSALDRIKGAELDGALLDVNLAGETSFGIASVLASRNVPFIFLTGYDREAVFPSEFRSAPKLAKPIATEALQEMMTLHFHRSL
jgi:CheY-like chemotaxis protein